MSILKNIRNSFLLIFHEILCSPAYVLLALFFASMVLTVFLWLPNFELITGIVFSSNVSFLKKVTFIFNFFEILSTNFSVFSASLLILVSILFGLNISLIVLYFKKRIAFQRAGGVSILGMVTGLLGVGCASCSSFILSSLLGVGTAAAFTEVLPLKGQEFSMVGIAILMYELHVTTKAIANPLICDVGLQK